MRSILRACLTTVTIASAATALANSYVYVPMSRSVDESDLIVIGRVIHEAPDHYKSHLSGAGACGKSEAVITVIEVLRGHLEGSHPERLADGNYVQTVRVRHFEILTAGEGNFNAPHVSKVNTVYKGRLDGIWILRRADAAGVYCCARYPWPERLDELNNVRACIRSAFAEHSTPDTR
jgi:hypothetical protein